MKDGDVTARLIYVNNGEQDDYKELERQHIDVKGAIVIAKYGSGWRGLKVQLAADHGAVGCLIYSDPRDDGYYNGDVYPKGPYRPADGVQRGSAMIMQDYGGDPETPGWGSTPGARRLPQDQAITLQKIPALPAFIRRRRSLCSRRSTGPWRPRRGAARCRSRITSGQARRWCTSS